MLPSLDSKSKEELSMDDLFKLVAERKNVEGEGDGV